MAIFPTEHPSEELLESYCHGDLNHLADIEAHILNCRVCARKVSETVRAEVNNRDVRPSPIP